MYESGIRKSYVETNQVSRRHDSEQSYPVDHDELDRAVLASKLGKGALEDERGGFPIGEDAADLRVVRPLR